MNRDIISKAFENLLKIVVIFSFVVILILVFCDKYGGTTLGTICLFTYLVSLFLLLIRERFLRHVLIVKEKKIKKDIKTKNIRNRDCFTVSIDYKEYKILTDMAAEDDFISEYWEGHPLTFIFISFDDEEIHFNELDMDKSYYAYIGQDGDNNLFDLGVWYVTREEAIKCIKRYFFDEIEKYPAGFEAYRLAQYKSNILKKKEKVKIFVTNIKADESVKLTDEVSLHYVVCDCTVEGSNIAEKETHRVFSDKVYSDVITHGYYII